MLLRLFPIALYYLAVRYTALMSGRFINSFLYPGGEDAGFRGAGRLLSRAGLTSSFHARGTVSQMLQATFSSRELRFRAEERNQYPNNETVRGTMVAALRRKCLIVRPLFRGCVLLCVCVY